MARHDGKYGNVVLILVIVIIIVAVVMIWKWIDRIGRERLDRSRRSSQANREKRGAHREHSSRRVNAGNGREWTRQQNLQGFPHLPGMAEQLGQGAGKLTAPYPVMARHEVQSRWSDSSSRSHSKSSSDRSSSNGSSDCHKPRAPLIRTTVQGTSITVSWSPVSDADYYDIYVVDQTGEPVAMEIFFSGTTVTFSNLPSGVYFVIAFSGSNECGVRREFSESGPITIGTPQCIIDTDCPVGDRCASGTCVAGCTTNVNCPQGDVCIAGTCQVPPPQCTTDIQCPVSQHCVAGSCVPGCSTSINCPQGQTCQNGTCQPSCPTPVVTGVTLTGSWPGAIQFTFTGTGFAASGATFTFGWRALGSTGALAISGYMAPFLLTNNQWPDTPASDFPENTNCPGLPCCSAFDFGCTAAGCTGSPNPNVVMEFIGVVVTNDCGMSSAPTCWRFTTLCPGGPATGTQFTCP